MEKKQQKKDDRISIRFPDDLLAALKESAKRNERSFNREVIWRLRQSFGTQKSLEGFYDDKSV